jgi:hypothetical protein
MPSKSFERLAGLCALLAGVTGFVYSFAFIVLVVAGRAPDLGNLLAALCLMLGGLLTTAALAALYERLQAASAGLALLALLLGVAGALGALVHGGFDLANALNPPTADPLNAANLPFLVDPRGLLTFGVAGLGLLLNAWLIVRSGALPRSLGYLGYLLAALLIVVYLGRLIIVTATHPLVVGPALLTGFIVNPAWYIWLGLTLWRGK